MRSPPDNVIPLSPTAVISDDSIEQSSENRIFKAATPLCQFESTKKVPMFRKEQW